MTRACVHDVATHPPTLRTATRGEFGLLQTSIPMRLVLVLRRPRRSIVEQLAAFIDTAGLFSKVETAGGGYGNLTPSPRTSPRGSTWMLAAISLILVTGCSTGQSGNDRQVCEMLDALSRGPEDPEGFERAVQLAGPELRERLRTVAAEPTGDGTTVDTAAAYKDVLKICAAVGVPLS